MDVSGYPGVSPIIQNETNVVNPCFWGSTISGTPLPFGLGTVQAGKGKSGKGKTQALQRVQGKVKSFNPGASCGGSYWPRIFVHPNSQWPTAVHGSIMNNEDIWPQQIVRCTASEKAEQASLDTYVDVDCLYVSHQNPCGQLRISFGVGSKPMVPGTKG